MILRKGFGLASSERGSALPLAMIVMLLCSILGFTLVAMGMTEMQISGSWKQYSAAFYAAESGIDSGVVALRTILASTPTPTAAQLSGITARPQRSQALLRQLFGGL